MFKISFNCVSWTNSANWEIVSKYQYSLKTSLLTLYLPSWKSNFWMSSASCSVRFKSSNVNISQNFLLYFRFDNAEIIFLQIFPLISIIASRKVYKEKLLGKSSESVLSCISSDIFRETASLTFPSCPVRLFIKTKASSRFKTLSNFSAASCFWTILPLLSMHISSSWLCVLIIKS